MILIRRSAGFQETLINNYKILHMKTILRNIGIAFCMIVFLSACKENKNENRDTQQYDETEKSTVTETGQHIGNNADSTSIDGEPGNPSNN
jgi:penicillin-binding protein-related factor A (putative recombinase)